MPQVGLEYDSPTSHLPPPGDQGQGVRRSMDACGLEAVQTRDWDSWSIGSGCLVDRARWMFVQQRRHCGLRRESGVVRSSAQPNAAHLEAAGHPAAVKRASLRRRGSAGTAVSIGVDQSTGAPHILRSGHLAIRPAKHPWRRKLGDIHRNERRMGRGGHKRSRLRREHRATGANHRAHRSPAHENVKPRPADTGHPLFHSHEVSGRARAIPSPAGQLRQSVDAQLVRLGGFHGRDGDSYSARVDECG